ncbi:MAG: hypothetical protein BWY66_00256 [bacterium ADurb.Bin374]|nr:MAG: hypothetical protein BWY66_00256 [bacterium ADurb.Bin374]
MHAMGAKPLTNEVFEQIREALSLKEFARPWAVQLDDGDLGTVFTYIPLSPEEFKTLGPTLQSYVYVIGKGRYGLVGHVPKSFDAAEEGDITGVTVVYNLYHTIVEMSYMLDGHQQPFRVYHTMRRDKLLEYAKKKKIPVKTVIRS